MPGPDSHPTAERSHLVVSFSAPDRPGIVHRLTGGIVGADGNITELQQYSSADTGRFFTRVQVETPRSRAALRTGLRSQLADLDGVLRVDEVGRPLRTLVLASTAWHCVNDLLYRVRTGGLPIEVPLILANHDDLAELAGFYRVPLEALPIASPADKALFERRVLEAVDELDIELVVLARYMQILSPELCDALAGRAINIHHSFLPGFKGANPYRQAHRRGVKLIGATAHFVTTDLDEGPIIEQNVVRVDHTMTPRDLMSMGQDVEAQTLRQAVRWFAEHRVLLDGERTVIFR